MVAVMRPALGEGCGSGMVFGRSDEVVGDFEDRRVGLAFSTSLRAWKTRTPEGRAISVGDLRPASKKTDDADGDDCDVIPAQRGGE
jgi:hypothetical protein